MHFQLIFILSWIFQFSSVYSQINDKLASITSDEGPVNRKVHHCTLDHNQIPFNVLPGNGWDNLVNQELGQVIKITYNKCRPSSDGRFLVPDDVLISPLKRSILILDSEMFNHYSNYTSMTAKSINLEANHATPYRKISGSYSYEKQSVKNDQIREKSKSTRTQLRFELYAISYQPDIELNEKFKNRVLEMGAVILADEDKLYPKYLADLIVRDFGTHIIRSVEAGAILSKTDVIKSSYAKQFEADETDLRVAASFSMAKMFGIDLKTSQTTSDTKLYEYNSNCASTRINTAGGRIFGSKFTIEEWEKTLEENLVAVDRRGNPIYNVITPSVVQELDKKTLYTVVQNIKEAVNRYYEANTRSGCMDMRSPNFNSDANVDSGDCQEPDIKFNFGGTFQNCHGDDELCSEISESNPATGRMSCPLGYDPIILQYEQYKCRSKCRSRFFFFETCNTFCASYVLNWCSPNGQNTRGTGFLFGGSYTDSTPNPVTNSNTCPQFFITRKFGVNAKICLSSEKENGFKNSILFGGFYSCIVGNSLSEDTNPIYSANKDYWLKSCARGYSSHMVTVDRTCQISYCAKAYSGKFKAVESPPIIRPPFIDIEFGPNLTLASSFVTPNGIVLKMSTDGSWKEIPTKDNHKFATTITVSVFGTLFIGLFMTFLVYFIHKNRTRRTKRVVSDDNEMQIQGQSDGIDNHGLT